jgi:hypothetical protein
MLDDVGIALSREVNVVLSCYLFQCTNSCLQVRCWNATSDTTSVQNPAVGNAKTGNVLFQAGTQASYLNQKLSSVFLFRNIGTVTCKIATAAVQIARQWWNNHNGTLPF